MLEPREEIIRIAPFVLSIIIAATGWVFTYLHKWHFDNKANKLDRVNKQLRNLYCPLYALLMASHSTWEEFWKKHRPAHGGSSYFGSNANVTDQEKKVWRNWMINVFEPLNSEAEDIIFKNIDLLESDEIPPAFIDALAHIAAYKTVLADWSNSDFSNHVSVNNWPSRELLSIVKPEYEKLRALQRELMGA